MTAEAPDSLKLALARDYEAAVDDIGTIGLAGVRIWRLTLRGNRPLQEVLTRLLTDRRVITAQPNYIYTPVQGPPQANEPPPSEPAAPAPRSGSEMPTGAGVKLAIIDTCMEATHSELMGSVTASYDAIKPGAGACAPENHGTAVASLIAGHSRLHGTAPEASLLRIRAFTFTEEENEVAATSREISLALKWAVRLGRTRGEFELCRTGRSAHRARDCRRVPQRDGSRRCGGQCRPGLRAALSRRIPGSDRGDRNERETANLQRRQQGQAHFRFRPRGRCARRTCAKHLRDRVRHLIRSRESQRHRGRAYRDPPAGRTRRNPSGAAEHRYRRSGTRPGRGGLRPCQRTGRHRLRRDLRPPIGRLLGHCASRTGRSRNFRGLTAVSAMMERLFLAGPRLTQ